MKGIGSDGLNEINRFMESMIGNLKKVDTKHIVSMMLGLTVLAVVYRSVKRVATIFKNRKAAKALKQKQEFRKKLLMETTKKLDKKDLESIKESGSSANITIKKDRFDELSSFAEDELGIDLKDFAMQDGNTFTFSKEGEEIYAKTAVLYTALNNIDDELHDILSSKINEDKIENPAATAFKEIGYADAGSFLFDAIAGANLGHSVPGSNGGVVFLKKDFIDHLSKKFNKYGRNVKIAEMTLDRFKALSKYVPNMRIVAGVRNSAYVLFNNNEMNKHLSSAANKLEKAKRLKELKKPEEAKGPEKVASSKKGAKGKKSKKGKKTGKDSNKWKASKESKETQTPQITQTTEATQTTQTPEETQTPQKTQTTQTTQTPEAPKGDNGTPV